MAGEFSSAQRTRIDRAVREAEQTCRYEFSVYVGAAQGPAREWAHRLHASLTRPARSILLLVDPAACVFEVVTGSEARETLSDDGVERATARMHSALGSGDLVDGLVHGIADLADAARSDAVRATNRSAELG